MKITLQRSAFIERLQHVTKAVASKITLPILEGVLIESAGGLTLTCSDTHLTIKTTLEDYEEVDAGKAVIPAKKLLEVIRKMPEKQISIDVTGSKALIKCGSTKVELPALEQDEFPEKHFPAEAMASIDGDQFAKLIDNTKFAVSSNEATPVLQGIQILQEHGKITAIATDRHRLAKQSISLGTDVGAEGDSQHVAPVKALEAVVQLKQDAVELSFSDNNIYLRAGAYQYIGALPSGSYPDTSRIIPTSANITALINTKQLLQTIELAEKIVEEKTKIVRLEVSDGEVHVSARDGAAGMEESLGAEVIGEEIKLSLNAKYLIDAVKCISTERTELLFTGALAPVIVRAEGNESGLHLVLPYRTTG